MSQKIAPFLWFDTQAEEAANFYVSVFKNSKITKLVRWPEGSPAPAGSVLTISFILDGQEVTALNGGPKFKFSEAFSFVISCSDQEEVDYYWNKLTADGGLESMCGWLKDKYGFSWQVFPEALGAMMADKDSSKVQRVVQAFMKMKKFDIATLQRAFDGK
jgi:predicted 3-demethylubiquinone-9 3-methyltransferase (glyoxalase superfamily)